jgi:hypothetical protein
MATSLQDHVHALEAFLRKDGDAPAWSQVLIIEDRLIGHGVVTKIPRNALQPVEAFGPRFSELANRGYGWINLVGNGICENALIVSVETPREPTGAPLDKVAVNVSGPYFERDGSKRWDLAGRVELT